MDGTRRALSTPRWTELGGRSPPQDGRNSAGVVHPKMDGTQRGSELSGVDSSAASSAAWRAGSWMCRRLARVYLDSLSIEKSVDSAPPRRRRGGRAAGSAVASPENISTRSPSRRASTRAPPRRRRGGRAAGSAVLSPRRSISRLALHTQASRERHAQAQRRPGRSRSCRHQMHCRRRSTRAARRLIDFLAWGRCAVPYRARPRRQAVEVRDVGRHNAQPRQGPSRSSSPRHRDLR